MPLFAFVCCLSQNVKIASGVTTLACGYLGRSSSRPGNSFGKFRCPDKNVVEVDCRMDALLWSCPLMVEPNRLQITMKQGITVKPLRSDKQLGRHIGDGKDPTVRSVVQDIMGWRFKMRPLMTRPTADCIEDWLERKDDMAKRGWRVEGLDPAALRRACGPECSGATNG